MTVEEIEIIVTAKVEEALKEFQKIMPELQKTMKQAEESFSKVDTKAMTNKFHQAVNFMKKKMQDLKKSSENNEIAIKVNNKDAQKQITQIEKEIDSLQKKITGRQLKLDVTNNALDKMRNDTNQSVIKEMPDAGNKRITQETYKRLDSNTNYQSLVKESDKLNSEIEKYNALLNSAKSKMAELEKQTSKNSTTQNKLSSFFGSFKQKVEQAKPSIASIRKSFNDMPKITQNITNNIKGMGIKLKSGLGHILKYAGALFSLQSIYSTLSGCASKWLSSQNAGAKQLSANIDYMKYAMGSAFAPVIQYVTNLVYQLMKAIQSVVYALFKVNIFANASAKSYASMAGSAKKASKETNKMADIDEIHNIQKDSDSSGGSGSGGSTPSFDLSNIDTQMSALSQKLYDFFKPLVDSWNKYGAGLIEQLKTTAGQVTELISAVWGSFEKIITNGTVYKTLELILSIIGNIAEAFANAWNYNGNGDAIIQNLANALNNLLTAIDNVVQSDGFQDWLNNCSDKFRVISEKIAEINWQPMIDALSQLGSTIGTVALDVLEVLTDSFKWLVEHPEVSGTILAIVAAYKALAAILGIVSALKASETLAFIASLAAKLSDAAETAILIGMYAAEAVQAGIATAATWLLNAAIAVLTSPITLVVLAIVALIAIIVLCVKHWDEIKETMIKVATTIKEKVITAFNYMKDKISTIFNNIKNTITNIWNGIWGAIKGVINKILGGIESFVNGTIRGINILLKGIEGLANAVGSVLGFNSITLQLNEVSLPRLAKGGVLTEATAVIAGEYSGAKSNPEIVTPQNIMAETMRNVLKERNSNNDTINFVNELKVNGKTFAREIIQDLNDEAKRLGYKPILERG